jgi:uncharacterized protein (TIGR02118 family)
MKLIFVLFRRSDLSHEQAIAEWGGEQHVSIVRTVPGLSKWVQNAPKYPPKKGEADGIGELWFDTVEALQKAMSSPQTASAMKDAERFLDMEKTYAMVVKETTVIGQ